MRKSQMKNTDTQNFFNKDISQRLWDLRKSNNLTLKEVADLIDLSPSALSDYENGNKFPRVDKLHLLAKFYKVNLEWLLEGFGQKFKIPEILSENQIQNFRKIPILAKISAGIPGEVFSEDIIGYDLVPDIPKFHQVQSAIQVNGQSMEPTLCDGDVLWIVQNFNPQDISKKIVVIRYNDDCCAIRRYRKYQSTQLFSADNPEYDPICSPPEKVEILALVIYLSRAL